MDELFERLYELMLKLLNIKNRRRSATNESKKLFEELEMNNLPAVNLNGYTNGVRPIILDNGFGINELSSKYLVTPEVWLDVAIRSATRAIENSEATAIPMEKLRDKLRQLYEEK